MVAAPARGRKVFAVRLLQVSWHLFLTVLKRRLAYRGDLLVQALDEVLRGSLALLMLQVYVSRTGSINGWRSEELLFILGFSLVPIALFHCFCSNLYQLSGRYILEGNFDRVLLRPCPAFLQICLDGIAIEDLSGVLFGSAVMAVAVQRGALESFGPWELLLLIGLLISAFLVVVAIFMAVSATAFWFEDRVGMVPPVYNLLEFGRWPTTLYPPFLKLLVTVALPFAFTGFYPATWFLAGGPDRPDWVWSLMTPVVAVVALIVANLAWGYGVRRYGSTGN